MSTTAPLQTRAAKSQASSNSTSQAGSLLPRECACEPLGGEFEDLKGHAGLQAKLTLGDSNDPLEREADRAAEQVLRVPAIPGVGAAILRIQCFMGPASAPTGAAVPASVERVLAGSGRQLEPPLRQDMEQRFGHDFSRVRVHCGAAAEQSARCLNANAYTVGHHIVFAAGRFALGTHEGRRLIAHELTHVVQQSQPAGLGSGQINAMRGLPSISSSAVHLARDLDAGVPPDAGPAGGPSDAAPIAGVPGGSPVPAAPPAGTPPAATPSATIGAVTFRGSINRIAPTRTAMVPVTVTGLPAGGSATIDVEASGGVNGSATITAGATLATSGDVTVRGGTQTTPGNAGKLKVRATSGGTVIGRSPGFTVAAWPADFTTSRSNDINTGGAVGVAAQNAWVSDGSALAELNEAERTERVDIGSRDNPPFTSGSGTSATAGTSGFIAGTASPTTDRHSYGKAVIDTSRVVPGAYTLVYRQNFLLNDRRTGTTNVVVQNSGFTITHTVLVMDLPVVGRFVGHTTVKRGAAVTVEGKAATAGSGTASSDTHVL